MEDNIDKEVYLNRIAEKIEDILKEECYVDVRQVFSCGITQPGIFMMPLKGLPNMAAVVGIIDMEDYGWDITDPDECAERLVQMYAENMELLEAYGFTRERVIWEKVKDFIYPVLMPFKKNAEILSGLVYRKELDFAVAYMVRVKPNEETPWMLVRITESMFNLWEISGEQLHNTAMENLRREGYFVADYNRMMENPNVVSPEEAAPKGSLEMRKLYILTNRTMYYGEAVILDLELLKMLSGGGNLYILPVEMHGVMVLKDDGKIRECHYNEIVRIMGCSGNEGEARFANHAYCYDGEKNELRECYG